MPSNTAAWLVAEKQSPLEVKDLSDDMHPFENEILIKNHAIAINPIDTKIQKLAFFPMKYPAVLGQDIAGEVIEIGTAVTRFKRGDRVVGHAAGLLEQNHRETAFQQYTILQSHMASPIPESTTYESASVIPLCISTAACGLFQPAPFLDMQLPTEPAQKATGKTVVIWGGSSCVGSNAIQMSVAAGYEVITTASPKNHGYVTKLGASQAFDHGSPTAVEDITATCRGKQIVGCLDCIGGPALEACVGIVKGLANDLGSDCPIATVRPLPAEIPAGVSIKLIFGLDLLKTKLGSAIYERYLPRAIESGAYVPSPEPMIIGEGLDKLQKGMDILFEGVSAAKVVVSL